MLMYRSLKECFINAKTRVKRMETILFAWVADNIHSLLNKEQKWTGSYWDEFASLPAIVPQGPIAILGLGGGTVAHLMLEVWPSLHLEGWEIDELLIDVAREYFSLCDLEECTQAGGSLKVHIGDALSPSVTVQGGFAGIIVDLFSDGKVLPQLKEVDTWLEMDKKLMPHGRIMVNCGGSHAEALTNGDCSLNIKSSNSSWVQNSTIKALCQAFPGKLSWKRMAEKESDNYLALTGPLPDLITWSAALPCPLSLGVKHWRSCKNYDGCPILCLQKHAPRDGRWSSAELPKFKSGFILITGSKLCFLRSLSMFQCLILFLIDLKNLLVTDCHSITQHLPLWTMQYYTEATKVQKIKNVRSCSQHVQWDD